MRSVALYTATGRIFFRGKRGDAERRKRRAVNGTEAGAPEAENRHGGGAPGGRYPETVPRREAAAGAAHHRQRAVLEAAALAADGEGGAGRQSRGPAAHQRVAGELHPVQARGCHGLLSGAHGAAPGARGPGGGPEADEDPAGGAEEERVQADVFQRVVVQAEIRVRRVRRVLGRGEAQWTGRHRHPADGPAEPVLGAGGHGYPGLAPLLLHGAAGPGGPGGAISLGQGQGRPGRLEREPVSV